MQIIVKELKGRRGDQDKRISTPVPKCRLCLKKKKKQHTLVDSHKLCHTDSTSVKAQGEAQYVCIWTYETENTFAMTPRTTEHIKNIHSIQINTYFVEF